MREIKRAQETELYSDKSRVVVQASDLQGVNSIEHWEDVDSQDICFGEDQNKNRSL